MDLKFFEYKSGFRFNWKGFLNRIVTFVKMKISDLPLVSVVLCTYNAGQHLNLQLESLIKQSYNNIEIIVVDDCSTDLTLKILNDYQAIHGFKIYSNKTNIGFNKNFERGISLATGDYIAICDQDDIWEINKIEFLVNNIKDNMLIFSNSKFIDSYDLEIGKELLPESFNLDGMGFKSILLRNFVTGHTCLFSREFITYILPLPESGYYDWFMGFVAIYYNKIAFLNIELTRYREHSASVIQQSLLSPENKKNELIRVNYQSTLTELKHFKKYKGLKLKDKVFIDSLVNMYETISEKSFLRWFTFIYFNYNKLFPFDKRRKLLSKTRILKANLFVKEILNIRKSVH